MSLCISFVLNFIHQVDAGVYETVDAVGQAVFFVSGECGPRDACNTPIIYEAISFESNSLGDQNILVPAHCS